MPKIHITKFFQDDIIKEVFRDEDETYIATTTTPYMNLPITNTLRIERLARHPSQIRDRWTNDYRTLDWSEIWDHTWNILPLFKEESPQRIAHLNEAAFYDFTFTPPRPHIRADPTLSKRTTTRGPSKRAIAPPYEEIDLELP